MYRIEVSPNNRAGCKETVCKKNGEKIAKGTLRWGTWVEIESVGHGSWAWKHWGCVSGAMIANARESISKPDGTYDYDMLDGYEDLNGSPDIQAKIRHVIEQGHIDLEEFKGDPEKCKLGQRGIWLTKAQRAKKEKDEAEAESSEQGGKPTPKKAKRGRKKTEDESDEDDAPKPKKARRSTGKSAKHEEGGSDDETPKPKTAGKSAKAVKNEDDEGGEDGAPKPKRASKAPGKVAKTVKHEEHGSDDSDDKPLIVKSTRRSKSAGKVKAQSEEPEEEEPQSENEEPEKKPFPAKSTRGRKSAGKVKAESEKHEAKPLPGRTSLSRKVKTESKGETAAPAPAKRGRRSSAKAAE